MVQIFSDFYSKYLDSVPVRLGDIQREPGIDWFPGSPDSGDTELCLREVKPSMSTEMAADVDLVF